MRRREFIKLLGGTLTFRSIAVGAQEAGRSRRLGFLVPNPRQLPAVHALFDELRLNGFVEGQNLFVIPNGFEALGDNVDELARALIDAKPDVVIAGPELQLRALQKLTDTVPIAGMSEDMVDEGLVTSLAHPGGNITGISLLSPELDGKRQDILIEAVPEARRIGAMADARVTPAFHVQSLQHAAKSRGIEVLVFRVGAPDQIASAIDAAKASGVEALNFLATPLFSIPGAQNNLFVMERVNAARLPAIFQWPETAEEAGAILAYGPRFVDIFRQRARIAVKILRGEKPANIPVQQPDKFELVINLKAAKAIGVEVPATLVARADKLIDERT
jgi:putative tryptophan/tyrosine transport system substrate-binding protein